MISEQQKIRKLEKSAANRKYQKSTSTTLTHLADDIGRVNDLDHRKTNLKKGKVEAKPR